MSRTLRFFALAILLFFCGPGVSAGSGPDIDPALRWILRPSETPGVGSASRAEGPFLRSLGTGLDDPQLEVFLRVSPKGLPDVPGLDAMPMGGDLYVARVSLEVLRTLIAAGSLSSVRLSRPVELALDQSTVFLGMGAVRQLDRGAGTFRGQTGRGVVVGIVDSGVDWLHPDFRKPGGGTRLVWYWDQTAYGWTHPRAYPFGAEYTAREINLGIAGGIDPQGHGTHVLGIAAGNGRGSLGSAEPAPRAGIAPEATLIAVRSNFTEAGVALGARYVFEQAQALGQPAVINLSLGNHFGPHRGTTPFESALTSLVGPGRLIVAAAGNDGARDIHAEMHFATLEAQEFTLRFPPYDKGTPAFLAFEAWYPRTDRYRIVVRSPPGVVVGALELGDEEAEFHDEKGTVLGWHVDDLGMRTFYLEIGDNPFSGRVATGTWTVRVEPITVGPSSEVDGWLVAYDGFPAGTSPALLSPLDPEETIMSPACAPGILAVGALATRACWLDTSGTEECYSVPPALGEVAYFSSRGPTPDGRAKPEILAPGFGVVSARSSGILPQFASAEELAHLSTPGGLYYVSQGTSMAAPHVTGTVALLLAHYPELTYEQMEARLEARGRRMLDRRDGRPAISLHVAETLAPVVDMFLPELAALPTGILIRWSVARTRGPVGYRVDRSFDSGGPFRTRVPGGTAGKNSFEVLDTQVEPGRRHYYRLAAVDAFGLEDSLTVVSTEALGTPVAAFRPPEPNPARGPVTFRYFAPESGSVPRLRLSVFDASGRRVTTVDASAAREAGEGTYRWDLTDGTGTRVAAGVYFARFEVGSDGAPGRVFVRRLVVLP